MRARITEAASGKVWPVTFVIRHEHMQNNHEVPITIVRSCFRKAKRCVSNKGNEAFVKVLVSRKLRKEKFNPIIYIYIYIKLRNNELKERKDSFIGRGNWIDVPI